MSFASEALAEFHAFYGRDDPEKWPELRKRLINEEHAELDHELSRDELDLEATYKEVADLVYVCYGLDWHLGGYLDRVMSEVHASNMSKRWECELCHGSGCGVLPYPEADIETCTCCPMCDGAGSVVKRREDGKVLKPPTYTPPDLSFIK